jgi:thiamine-monophosphate kinase
LQPEARRRACALAGGDDYELMFTAPVAARAQIESAARGARAQVARIGSMTSTRGLVVLDRGGERIDLRQHGFDHFG